MIKNKILPFLFSLIITGNRAVSQSFSISGLYYYEFLLLLAATMKPYRLVKTLANLYPCLLLIFYTLLLLGREAFAGELNEYSLRRAALGIYVITPVIFLCFKIEISNFLNKNIWLFITLASFFITINPGGFQFTMAAQLAGAFILYYSINKEFKLPLLLFTILFIFSITGFFSGGTIYRTPVMSLLIATSIFIVLNTRKNTFSIKALIFFIIITIILFGLTSVGFFDKTIGAIALGLSGLLDSQSLQQLGLSLVGDSASSRGDAVGNAQTRTIFWASIIDHQMSDLGSFLFGNGFEKGFMEVTLPHMAFIEKPLIEPHNSFLSIFFRFGIVGIVLFLLTFLMVVKKISTTPTSTLPFIAIALSYASFEVALENPHGAILFWFIIFLPYLLDKNHRVSKRLKT